MAWSKPHGHGRRLTCRHGRELTLNADEGAHRLKAPWLASFCMEIPTSAIANPSTTAEAIATCTAAAGKARTLLRGFCDGRWGAGGAVAVVWR
jgi:hypothetical protein